MPLSESVLVPSLQGAAAKLWEDLNATVRADGASVDMIIDRMRHLLEIESTSCEALATARGDQLQKHGDARSAEVAYGIAGAIRLRREAWLDEVRPF